MWPEKRQSCGSVLLFLYNSAGRAAAQTGNTLFDGCYWTSSIIFGNVTSGIISTPASTGTSTSNNGGVNVSPILASTTSSSSTNNPPILATTASSVLVFSSSALAPFSTSISPSLTSPIPSSSVSSTTVFTSSAFPAPTPTAFHVAVSGFNSKLRARSDSYIYLVDNNAYLTPDVTIAATFMLSDDGQLVTDYGNVGTDGHFGSLPLMLFADSFQPSGYNWSLQDTKLTFGDNLPFVALQDGQIYVTYPGAAPPAGAVQLDLVPQYIPIVVSTTDSGTGLTSSSSGVPTSTMASDVVATTTSQPVSQVSSVAASTSEPDPGQATTTIPSTPAVAPTSVSASQSTSRLPSSASSSATTTTSPQRQSTNVQSSSTTQPFSSTRSILSQTASSVLVSSVSVSPSTSVTTSTFPGVLAPATSSSLSGTSYTSSYSTAPGTTGAVTIASTQIGSTSRSTTTSIPTSSSTIGATTISASQLQSTSITPTTTPAQSATSRPSSLTSSTTSTTTTYSRTATSSPSSTASAYPAKRGLPYHNVTTLTYWVPPSPYVSWAYDYYSLPNNTDNVGSYPYPSLPYRFIPLLYNNATSLTSIWPANVEFCIQNYGTDAIFGYNEPDANFYQQSANLPVAESIKGYKNFMEPFAGRVKIGAPAITNTDGGRSYLAQFLGNATQQNLTIDFINIHWYASPYFPQDFKNYLAQIYNICATYSPHLKSSFHNTSAGEVLPIWVTEFGMDQNFYDITVIESFMKNTTSFMDKQPWVERYAWFGNYPEGTGTYGGSATDKLLNFDGSGRSGLGDVYHSYSGS